MSGPVLVVGASGNQGGACARRLAERGVPLRVAGRDTVALRDRFPRAEVVRFDLRDRSTFATATARICGMFLVRPPAIARVGSTLNMLLDVAARQGSPHVVFSSVAGAEKSRAVPHRRVEDHLRRCGLPWTILRPGFFLQNLVDAYRIDLVHEGRLFVPAGDGRVAWVDARDVGEVAARVLAAPRDFEGEVDLLTGAQAYSFADTAAVLAEELGRPIRYEPASVPSYARHLRERHGLGCMQTFVQTWLHLGLRRGAAEHVSPRLGERLGRAPTSLRDFVREQREEWAIAGASRPVPAA